MQTSTKRMLEPVPFTNIQFTDAFWAPRIEVNRRVSLRHIHRKLVETGRIDAFDLNFTRPVPSSILLIFGDSDPAKWLEAASYSLATHPDPELEALVDEVADKVISAQQPDGYLNTHFIHIQPEMRWKNLRDWHEMYCAGHLIEGAVAHYRSHQQPEAAQRTQPLCRPYRRNLWARARQKTWLLRSPRDRAGAGPPVQGDRQSTLPGTGELLCRRARPAVRTQPHYYDIEAIARGDDPRAFWAKSYEYNQSHQPVREQAKVVGHAVRAMYLLSAAADLASEKDDASLLETCDRLWDNLVNYRMYLTGGIGPSRS